MTRAIRLVRESGNFQHTRREVNTLVEKNWSTLAHSGEMRFLSDRATTAQHPVFAPPVFVASALTTFNLEKIEWIANEKKNRLGDLSDRLPSRCAVSVDFPVTPCCRRSSAGTRPPRIRLAPRTRPRRASVPAPPERPERRKRPHTPCDSTAKSCPSCCPARRPV